MQAAKALITWCCKETLDFIYVDEADRLVKERKGMFLARDGKFHILRSYKEKENSKQVHNFMTAVDKRTGCKAQVDDAVQRFNLVEAHYCKARRKDAAALLFQVWLP